MIANNMEAKPTLHYNFNISFYADEIAMRGYCDNIVARLPDGDSYVICFCDLVRLSQDIEDENYIAIPNLIIVSELRRDQMENAVDKAWRKGFFQNLKPLNNNTR